MTEANNTIDTTKRKSGFSSTFGRIRKSTAIEELNLVASVSAEGVICDEELDITDRIDHKEDGPNSANEYKGNKGLSTYASLNGLENIVLKMIQGDITKINTEVTIVPGNEKLSPLGGVAKAVFEAAGSELVADIQKKTGGKALTVGNVLFTSSGALKGNVSQIVHIVTPRWRTFEHRTGKMECMRIFLSALCDCFEQCVGKSITKISLPAIGTGYCGIPEKLCCFVYSIALFELNEYCKSKNGTKMEISFVDISIDILACICDECSRAFEKGLESLENSIDEEIEKLLGIKTYKIGQTIQMKVFQGNINLFVEESTICSVNKDLKPRGREAESIFTQAGKDFQRELASQKETREIEPGDVIVTGAGSLYRNRVFNCVIPKRKLLLFRGSLNHKEQLCQCYKNAFRMASENNISVMALYALGTDTGYLEKELCCSALVDALKSLSGPSEKSSLSTLHVICKTKTLLTSLLNRINCLFKNVK